MTDAVDLSLVVPVYNEEESIDIFLDRVVPILSSTGLTFEIIFINDGSRDQTLRLIENANRRDPRIIGLDLSRNFGKEAALSAGLDFARGRALIPMDVDLQDPPELLPEMTALWQQGYEVVLAKRIDRNSDSWAKRQSSRFFYASMAVLSDIEIPSNVGDFRLMDRKVVDALKRLSERTRFMKGIFAWLGFKEAVVNYSRPQRAAGKTKWRPLALFRLGLEGLVSFSTFPLRLSSFIGASCAALGFLYGVFIAIRTLIFGIDLPGYASMMSVNMFFDGVILLCLGIVGEYISRIFAEVKQRPLYLIREIIS